MSFDDRLREELRQRSAAIDVNAAGPRHVIRAAQARTRRARIVGGVSVALFLVVVGGAAIALRDSGPDAQLEATTTTGGDLTGEETADGAGDAPADQPDDGADSGAEGEELAVTDAADATAQAVAGRGGPDQAAEDEPIEQAAPNVAEDPAVAEEAAPAPPAAGADIRDLVGHRNGFVAVRSANVDRSGASLAFTSNGSTWTDVADPKPTSRSTITQVASHANTLYVAGDRPDGDVTRPWIAATTDLATWTEIEVPAAPAPDSDLTTASTRIYALSAGPAGMLATGETIVGLRIEQLVPASVLDAGSWSLGDSSGDMSKVVVYDASGAVEREIDLVAEGISKDTIDRWADGTPTSFVAIGPVGGPLRRANTDLPARTLLTDGLVGENTFVSAGFSPQFSSRIVWESTDGESWTGAPVGVVANEHADMLGLVGGRLTVFTSQGPLFTVQQQRGDTWRESRLDPQFGNTNDDYLLVDAAFDDSGVVAVIATIGQSDNRALWLATSQNGTAWDVAPIEAELGIASTVRDVKGLALSPTSIAVAYESGAGESRLAVVGR